MKKFTFLLGICILTITGLVAQVPSAFKYQAVIRDNRGEPIANKEVNLRIVLTQDQKESNSVYSEDHITISNEFGLVNLEIGRGKVTKGLFDKINWANGSYYIHVFMDLEGKGDFTSVGNSQLLSVPYALQARDVENGFSGEYKDLKGKPTKVSEFQNDAGYITGEELEEIDRGGAPVPTVDMIWNTKGNLGINPFINKFGTLDSADVVMVTNNTERLRILADGSITTTKALKVNQGFQVNGPVNLNQNYGSTVVNGPFTVERNQPSILTGSLRVDGATLLNSSLTVANMAPTILTGTLRVDKETDLNARLRVNNMAPSILTGTLQVDKETDLNARLRVNNMASTILTGSLQVDKITDLNSNLNVNNAAPTVLSGTLRVDQNSTFKQMVSIDNPTLGSFSFNTGALVVAGGVGIGQNLNVAGNSTFGGNANFLGIVNFSNTTQSTAINNGAVIIGGGLGLAKNLNIGGDFNINTNRFNVNAATGNTLVAGTLGVTGAALVNNTLGVTGATNLGNTLTVTGATTLNNTLAANGQVTIATNVGGGDNSYGAYPLRVQGSDQGIAIRLNAGTPNNSNNFITFFNGSGNAVGRIEGETTSEHTSNPEFIYNEAFLVAENIKNGVAIGLSFIPTCVAGLVVSCGVSGSSIAMAAADLVLSLANIVAFNIFELTDIGVTYESGSADYAEWLERADHSEKIIAGDIVGVYGGKISKYTAKAKQFMVISTKPAVLGNMPVSGQEQLYEKVAFMGQIPVKVKGNVIVGDYIIPSGLNDGVGRAVSPDEIKPEQYREIVGVAWSSVILKGGISLVNMAIGINGNDLANLAVKQDKRISVLEARMLALESGKTITTTDNPNSVVTNNGGTDTIGKTRDEEILSEMPSELSDDILDESLIYLKAQYDAQKIDLKRNPGLNKLLTDPKFKAEVVKKVQEDYKVNYQTYLDIQKSKI